MTTIRVRYSTLDHFSQSRSFKTLTAARRYAQKWVGQHPDTNGWYAVSNDGMGKITANVPMNDLFPPEGCFVSYTTRFVPQSDAAELVNLYHLARTVVGDDRVARKAKAARWYADEHPGTTPTGAYKDLDGLLAWEVVG